LPARAAESLNPIREPKKFAECQPTDEISRPVGANTSDREKAGQQKFEKNCFSIHALAPKGQSWRFKRPETRYRSARWEGSRLTNSTVAMQIS